MAEPPLLKRAQDGVLTLTINRPASLNAMDSHAHLALSEVLDDVAEDPAIRVVVLTGAGERAFSVGRDLKELAALEAGPQEDRDAADARWRRTTRLTDRFDFPKPLIARVNGLALGGGFELALACDLIIASSDATFALPEPRRGLIPFAGGVHRLPRQLPLKTAMGFLLTGRSLNAERALALGLVNEVCAPDQLDTVVAAWAADILACAPLSIRAIKQCVAEGLCRPIGEAMKATYAAEAQRQVSEDSREGPRAFAEKRAPVWRGR